MTSQEINSYTGPLADLVQRLAETFIAENSSPPEWIVAAPGRVNLIGEHIDYNDGFVLPMAIERYIVIAAAKSDSDEAVVNLRSVNMDQVAQLDLTKVPEPSLPPKWHSYIEGVFAGFMKKIGADASSKLPAMNLLLESNVPLGGGLSSSAALEVATATLLEAVTGVAMGLDEKALLCQKAEHDFAGVPCGIMDQFSSVFGQENAFMLLDCRSQELKHVPFSSDNISVLITNTNVKHELSGGEYGQRRSQCDSALKKLGADSWRNVTMAQVEAAKDQLGDVEFRRARHVVTEIDRTWKAAKAIESGQWDELGEMMYASHASLKDDYEVSCEELDLLVELANSIGSQGGVYGSRMTGGGFGGCTVTLVESTKVAEVTAEMEKQYQEKTGIEPHSFASRPAIGAHRIK
ncbi:Galactokinase [Planctomycetes bacterium CA13]|uniref:Galactokinase n=1 Tax=Novipirellula herctigrandis TaxID=2527986 RepID=A0A5C5ZAE4_9BACT|nr:Galactokinase [Planctomycetes bacterium CA13]